MQWNHTREQEAMILDFKAFEKVFFSLIFEKREHFKNSMRNYFGGKVF